MTASLLRRRKLLLASLLAACNLLAACGGNGGGDSAAASGTDSSPAGVASRDGAKAPASPAAPATDPKRTATVQLAWIAPRTNADGSPLIDLAGYRVRYGTRSGLYTNMVQIADPHRLSHVLNGLPARTYYITVAAYNSANIESVASDEVSKNLR